MKTNLTIRVAVALALALLSCAHAQDRYYSAGVGELKLEQPLPTVEDRWQSSLYVILHMQPRVVMSNGVGYAHADVSSPEAWNRPRNQNLRVSVRVPEEHEPRGILYVANTDNTGMVAIPFAFGSVQPSEDAHRNYLHARIQYYDSLRFTNIAGAASFRWESDKAKQELKQEFNEEYPDMVARATNSRLDDTYALFTGGRALSENLQLNRDITAAVSPENEKIEGTEVEVSTISGITVNAMDFSAMLAGDEPTLDALASAIPADQHSAFFPSIDALARVARETTEEGLPMFRAYTPRSEDAGLIARYEKQLGISTESLALDVERFGIRSVAVTGSDPYFATGTDVAVLIESNDADGLRQRMASVVFESGKQVPGARVVLGTAGEVEYAGAASQDRSVCSYVARIGDVVVVTNSLHQIDRLGAVASGAAPPLASLDEYRFFRKRYPRGEADETAFVMISDATIRRWCGPEWRIGASRRLRAGAILADLTAEHATELARGIDASREVTTRTPMRTIGETSLTPQGARSSVYNTLDFLTPIAELGITRVGADELRAYNAWRDSYQRNWRWAFDPIGIRLGVSDDRVTGDISVMPLILNTQYRTWLSFTQGAAITPGSGDPHDAIAHLTLAMNKDSIPVQSAIGLMRSGFAPGLDADPLEWLGQTVALYADPSPFWGELFEAISAGDEEEWMRLNLSRMPLAVRAEVTSPIALAAFLTSARGIIESSAPGMLAWENRTHNGQAYVTVRLTDEAQAAEQEFPDLTIYYAAMPRAVVVSLDEQTLHGAIDREKARAAARAEGRELGDVAFQWLGESAALKVTHDGLEVYRMASVAESGQKQLQARCWSNLPILNEWRARFPQQDPVVVYERLWGVRLICPAGGEYVWNEDYQTMESTVLGHPGQQKKADPQILETFEYANFGVTLESDSLRAIVDIKRAR